MTLSIQPFALKCTTSECRSLFEFPGGAISEFIDAFDAAYHAGWICLMEDILAMTCPACVATSHRRLLDHHLMRNRLVGQPDWKRDIIVSAWAAMTRIHDNEYLRDTDMPGWLNALLGKETTARGAHVRHTLEHLSWNLNRYQNLPDAIQASSLARTILGR